MDLLSPIINIIDYRFRDSPSLENSQKNDPSSGQFVLTLDELREERDKLIKLLNDGDLFSFAVTSNIAQLAQQRLNGDVTRLDTATCLVDPPTQTEPMSHSTMGEECPDEKNGQSDVETEYHSFKFWQSNYYQDISDASLTHIDTKSTIDPGKNVECGNKVEQARHDTYHQFKSNEDKLMEDYQKWATSVDADDNDALNSGEASSGQETMGQEKKQYDVVEGQDENKPRSSGDGQEQRGTDERSESPDQEPIPLGKFKCF